MSEHRFVKDPGRAVVTIGSFDGVHRGHQFLLTSARQRAEDLRLPLVIVTFEPLPSQVVRPGQFDGRLTTPELKLQHLLKVMPDHLETFTFDDTLRSMSPRTFLNDLRDRFHPAEILVGEEFALGHDRTGTIRVMCELGSKLGFTVSAVPRIKDNGDVVSSSRIRSSILDGRVDIANEMLGYEFPVSGEVIKGAQVGRTIGYPTANVAPPEQIVPVADGIYATWARIDDASNLHSAMTYIGTRPALNTGIRLIETHLLDFSGDLYGKTLRTDFVQRLRPDATFDSVEELIVQLDRDAIDARQVLANTLPSPDACGP